MSTPGSNARFDADDGVRSLYSGTLFLTTGVLAWVTGNPFVFPSLGPTAFLLATEYRREVPAARSVIGGHAIGVAAGLVSYHAIALGLTFGAAQPVFSLAELRLVASGLVALVLTTAGMLGLDSVHPPACATTLIVSLGVLPTLFESGLIVVSVVVLYLAHWGSVTFLFDT